MLLRQENKCKSDIIIQMSSKFKLRCMETDVELKPGFHGKLQKPIAPQKKKNSTDKAEELLGQEVGKHLRKATLDELFVV